MDRDVPYNTCSRYCTWFSIAIGDYRMNKQEAIEIVEHWFESVEIAEYEYIICASQSEPFWIEVKQAINILQGK